MKIGVNFVQIFHVGIVIVSGSIRRTYNIVIKGVLWKIPCSNGA